MNFGRSHSIIYFGIGFNLAFILTIAVLAGIVRRVLPDSTPRLVLLIGVVLPFITGLLFGLRLRRIGKENGLSLPKALKQALWL